MKKAIAVMALLLSVSILFSGCGIALLPGILELLEEQGGQAGEDLPEAAKGKRFSEFTYKRPDMEALDSILNKLRRVIEKGGSMDSLILAINRMYDLYDDFYTAYILAEIHYCADMTDEYWDEEYSFCIAASITVEQQLEQMYILLAQSDYRQELETDEYFGAGFFDSYLEGEGVWDSQYSSMAEREAQLQDDYYTLYAETTQQDYSDALYASYCEEAAQILVDLIAVRQEMAAYLGFESYAELAYIGYYDRDYTPQEAESYLTSLADGFGELYDRVYYHDMWGYSSGYCNEKMTFSYVEKAAKKMGGSIWEAFLVLRERELYDIRQSENKYDTCFSVYLDSYGVPFVFTCPYGITSDQLDFAHEFGHFTNDYLCSGSYAGTDVAEVQSQGMEYLSLCYSDNKKLEQYKLADSLDVYVAQSAYALFELRAYALTGDELTAENVKRIYGEICEQFGMVQSEWDPWSFVNIGHFYTDPMYVISYVVSNDLAMQLYELEKAEPGQGLALFEEALRSEEYYIMTFAKELGLESPFDPSRPAKILQTFTECFE